MFVENKSDICSNCSPVTCVDCGELTSKAFRRIPKLATQQKLATKLFGVGGSTGVCKECKHTDVLGTEERCTSCCRELARFPALHCISCTYKLRIGELWRPAERGVFNCMNCGEERQVDEYGFCYACSGIKGSKNAKECVNCHAIHEPINSTDTHCESCKPNCYGCDKRFSPIIKTQIFCTDCTSSIDQGLCTTCFDFVGEADDHGRCQKCSDGNITSRHWCRVCEVRPVKTADGVCPQCERRKIKCPFCPTKIAATEFACLDCLTNKYGQ